MNEAFEDSQRKVQEQEVVSKATGDMIEVMNNDPDPKFKNSKFLSFLREIDRGDIKVEGNELVFSEHSKGMEKEFQEAQKEIDQEEEAKLESAWKEAEKLDLAKDEDQAIFEKLLEEINRPVFTNFSI